MSDSSINNDSNEYYTIRELACNLRDAVVLIAGQAVLQPPTGDPIINTRRGNGFFIKGHYIICPADIVLIPISSFNNDARIPAYPDVPTYGKYPNSLIRASKILVDISNVNGCGKSYTYEADLIGIDGASNIAILRINMNNDWNKCNPPIRICHPFLHWGKSRNTCPGDTIISIGNTPAPADIALTQNISPILNAENAVVIGNISDNRYVFPGGQVPGELILLSNIFANGLQRGLPILTINGTVIGMVVFINSNFGYNVALSEFFMRRPIKALITSFQNHSISKSYQGFIEPVLDPINDYLRFNKGWLGLGGILMDEEDYNTNLQANVTLPSTSNIIRVPFLYTGPTGITATLVNGPDCKEIVGFRILAVAGPTAGTELFLPGAAPSITLVPTLKSSPLFGIIFPGDIVTHINGCPLGDRKSQISPSLVMWRVRPGDSVTILYKKQSERFEFTHEITICTSSYEPFLDYPFFSLDQPNFRAMVPTLI
jgi:S1-C subfamily serine protease